MSRGAIDIEKLRVALRRMSRGNLHIVAEREAGGARLASCLTWHLRSFASHWRRTHDATDVLAFTCTGPRTPSTLELSMAMSERPAASW